MGRSGSRNRVWLAVGCAVGSALAAPGCTLTGDCPAGTLPVAGRCVDDESEDSGDDAGDAGDASDALDAEAKPDTGVPCDGLVNDAGVCMPGCYAEACDGEDNDCDGIIDDGVLGFGAAQAFGDETTTVLAVLPRNANTHLVLFEGEPSPGDYSVQVTEISADGVRVLGKTRTVDPSSPSTPVKRAIAFKYGNYAVFAFWRSASNGRVVVYDAAAREVIGTYVSGNAALYGPTTNPAKLRLIDNPAGCVSIPGFRMMSHSYPSLASPQVVGAVTGAVPDCDGLVGLVPQVGTTESLYFMNGPNVARVTSSATLNLTSLAPGTYAARYVALDDGTGDVAFLYRVSSGPSTKTRFDLRTAELLPRASADLSPATSTEDDGFSMSSLALDDGTWLVTRPVEDSSGAATKLRFVVERFAREDDSLKETNTNFGPCDAALCPDKSLGAPLRTHVVETGGKVLVGVSNAKGGARFIPYGCH